MDTFEMSGLIRSTLENANPARRMQALKGLEVAIPQSERAMFDALVAVILAGVRDDPSAITVVLVHGIRTDAAWQQKFREEFKNEPSVNVVPLGYGFFTALGLWGPFRSAPVRKIARELRDIRRREPSAKIVLVAHSFGTYIASRLLSEAADIRFLRIILCGCIVSTKFRWDLLAPELDHTSIVNDVGTKDFYPVLATSCTFGYGSSGRLGFQTGRVRDRFFACGHSGFFTPEHISSYWKPFVLKGEIVASPVDAQRDPTPYAVSLLSTGPVLMWVLIVVALGALGSVLWL